MKEIKAIIQPFQLEKVLGALQAIPGLPGCIVSRVETFARLSGNQSLSLEAQERAKLEIVVKDSMVESIVDVIQKNAHTGRTGDGKIFIIEAIDAIRIRTAERGEKAL